MKVTIQGLTNPIYNGCTGTILHQATTNIDRWVVQVHNDNDPTSPHKLSIHQNNLHPSQTTPTTATNDEPDDTDLGQLLDEMLAVALVRDDSRDRDLRPTLANFLASREKLGSHGRGSRNAEDNDGIEVGRVVDRPDGDRW